MIDAHEKQITIPFTWIGVSLIPIAVYVTSLAGSAWTAAGNVATKTELAALKTEVFDVFKRTDETISKTLEASKKYTDDHTMAFRDQAFDHSDMNRKDLEVAQKVTQTRLDAVSSKLDNIESLILQIRKR